MFPVFSLHPTMQLVESKQQKKKLNDLNHSTEEEDEIDDEDIIRECVSLPSV